MPSLTYNECIEWIAGVCNDPKTSENGNAYYISCDDLYIVIVRIFDGGDGTVHFLPRKESMDGLFVARVNELIVDKDIETGKEVIDELCDGFMNVHGYEYRL